MRPLGVPASINELYRDRGEIENTIPLAQGDVFDNVDVPALGDAPMTVQVVMHPCSLRQGANLRPRITVAPVRKVGRQDANAWRSKYFNHMILPALYGNEDVYVTDFRDLAPVSSDNLTLESRVAVLSAVGTILLQQRMIFAQTRLAIEQHELATAAAPIFAEIDMQETWCECAVENCGAADHEKVLADSIADFHAWLDENDRARRAVLADVSRHAELRREVMRDSRSRYQRS